MCALMACSQVMCAPLGRSKLLACALCGRVPSPALSVKLGLALFPVGVKSGSVSRLALLRGEGATMAMMLPSGVTIMAWYLSSDGVGVPSSS